MRTTEKQAWEVKNYRQIKVGFLGATNTKSSRIVIFEPKRYNDDKTHRKVFSFDYGEGNSMEQAYKILIRNGFNIVARASEFENYIFLCDNWAEDFVKIEDLK